MDVLLGGTPVPVGKIVCVGRNYAEHAREMDARLGAMPAPAPSRHFIEDPFFFLKPATALVPSGGKIRIPPDVGEVHHEIELAALIGLRTVAATEAEAMRSIAGYAAFLDITARDLQTEAKKSGRPWSLAKGIDTFAPCGEFAPRLPQDLSSPDWPITLKVNGNTRQSGRTSQMIRALPALIAKASTYMTLEPGDILATGTPAGVGPIRPGDILEATIGPLPPLHVEARAW